MPDAIMEAPAAPPSAPAAPSAPSAPPPARSAPATNFPAPQPKGEVAKGVFDRLEKLATPTETPTARPPAKAPAKPPEAIAPPGTPDPKEPTVEKPADSGKPAPATVPADKPKVNPWKLVDDWKAKAAQAEARILEIQKGNPSPEALKTLNERLTKAEAKVKEYEDEIIHQDYKRHPEFKEKYDAPYEKAWVRSMKEMRELTVADAAGNERPVTADDLLELVNLPLKQAKTRANEMFGEFGEYAMERRNNIKQLYDAKTEAEIDARKNGETWQKENTDKQQKQDREIKDFVADNWQKSLERGHNHPKYGTYFKPAEGDEVGNNLLSRGYAQALKAFNENPADPRHSPEERAKIVNRHAVVFNKSAAFGNLVRLLHEERRLRAEDQKKLSGYEASAPSTAGREAAPANGAATSVKASLMDKLDALGKTS